MRIRSIKPNFWRDEEIVQLPLSTRLTFIGLWSYVDDNGVGDARVSSIVGDLYSDDMERDPQETLRRVSGDTRELENRGMIVRFTDPQNPRRELLYVTNWERHQVVNKPSKGNCYPLPPADMVQRARTLRTHSGDSPETLRAGAGEQGNRGTGEQGLKDSSTGSAAERVRHDYSDDFEEFWSRYPIKKSKRSASKAFTRALKRASFDTICAGADRYRDDPNRVDAFTQHAERWLNADGWEDGPLPSRIGTSSTKRENSFDAWGQPSGEPLMKDPFIDAEVVEFREIGR